MPESVDRKELVTLHNRAQNPTQDLHARAEGGLELAEELDRLTEDTSAWYAGTRARVEARAALEEDLRRVLEGMGERLEATGGRDESR